MILKNARLIPELSDGADFGLADIVIDDGKITDIFPAGKYSSESIDIIDLGGRTLLPGLFDLHAHLCIESAVDDAHHAQQKLVESLGRLPRYTDWGVTTIRDCGSTLRLATHVRDAVKSGIIKGPRVISSGHIIAPEVMREIGINKMLVMDISNSVDECIYSARKELALGADFVKIYASNSIMQCVEKDPMPLFRDCEIQAMAEIAELGGTYVAAHAHSRSSIRQCILNGVKCIEHATMIDDDCIELILKRGDVYIDPTVSVMQPDSVLSSSSYRSALERICEQGCECIGKAYRAGVFMGFGCDYVNVKYDSFFEEFRIRHEKCGMSPIDILLQATVNSAVIAGLESVTGKVRTGLSADLIAVDGRPDENISVMYKKPCFVMQAGEVLKNEL